MPLSLRTVNDTVFPAQYDIGDSGICYDTLCSDDTAIKHRIVAVLYSCTHEYIILKYIHIYIYITLREGANYPKQQKSNLGLQQMFFRTPKKLFEVNLYWGPGGSRGVRWPFLVQVCVGARRVNSEPKTLFLRCDVFDARMIAGFLKPWGHKCVI